MPGPVGEKQIKVEGLRELLAAFAVYNRSMGKDFRDAFLSAGEPVAQTAESLAVARIPRIGLPWSRMRVGFTRRIVYVAPERRGGNRNPRRHRPNLKDLLLDRAMIPAVDQNIGRVEAELEDALSDLAKAWGRV